MVNLSLMKVASVEDLKALGFTEENDGSGDPRGTDWNIRNDKFHLIIDPWFEVRLAHRLPDTDFIKVQVEDLDDLRNVIDFITF